MKYKVELAEFHSVIVEAESRKEAEEIVTVMDDEEILKQSVENTGMVIWSTSEVEQHEAQDGKQPNVL